MVLTLPFSALQDMPPEGEQKGSSAKARKQTNDHIGRPVYRAGILVRHDSVSANRYFLRILLERQNRICAILYNGRRSFDQNFRQIRFAVESLDRELIIFLEDMFDGDDILPDPDVLGRKFDAMQGMLHIFSQQRIFTHLKLQKKEVAAFEVCRDKALALVSRIYLLSVMGVPGHLSQEVCDLLAASGAKIKDKPWKGDLSERDIVINYHVKHILNLRRELLEALGEEIRLEEGK